MHEIRQVVKVLEDAQREAAQWPGGPNEGDWVLLGVLGRESENLNAVPVMEPKKRMVMRRYRSPEEAIGASVCHSCTRVGGGWAVNIRTGDVVAVRRYEGERHV